MCIYICRHTNFVNTNYLKFWTSLTFLKIFSPNTLISNLFRQGALRPYFKGNGHAFNAIVQVHLEGRSNFFQVTLYLKSGMPDSQRYLVNLYLSICERDIVVFLKFLHCLCSFEWETPFSEKLQLKRTEGYLTYPCLDTFIKRTILHQKCHFKGRVSWNYP